MANDYIKESSELQNLLNGIKKDEISPENFEKINTLIQIINRDTTNFNENKNQKNVNVKDSQEKIDLFFKKNQKTFKFSDVEISDFIGNFHNDEIIKQFYIVDNIKTKINNMYNDNIEDELKKEEFNILLKKFEKISVDYIKERDGIIKEYSVNEKNVRKNSYIKLIN
jgi:hypothetical protein